MHYFLYYYPVVDSDFSLSMGAAFVCNNEIREVGHPRCNSDYARFLRSFFSLHLRHLHCIGMQFTSSGPIYGAHVINDKMHRGWRKESSVRSCIQVHRCQRWMPFPSPASFPRFRWATLRNWRSGDRKGEEKRWKNRLNSLPSLSAQSRCRLPPSIASRWNAIYRFALQERTRYME